MEPVSLDYVYDYTKDLSSVREVHRRIEQEMGLMRTDPVYVTAHAAKLEAAFGVVVAESLFSHLLANSEIDDSFTLGVIDSSRYVAYETDGVIDTQRLEVLTAYHQMHQNSLRAMDLKLSRRGNDLLNTAAAAVAVVEHEVELVTEGIDGVNKARYEAQMAFKPTATFLEALWTRGVRNAVEMGVESTRLEYLRANEASRTLEEQRSASPKGECKRQRVV